MNAQVHTLADEKAAREAAEPFTLFEEDEMAAALARAPDLPDEPEHEEPPMQDLPPLVHQWLRFRDQFEEAMEGGLYRIADLERDIAEGKAYLWPGRNAAVVAQRVVYPSGEAVMQTLWAVGDVEEILAMAPGIEATARLMGCTSMLVEGRAGWTKILKPQGYEPWSVTVRKVL